MTFEDIFQIGEAAHKAVMKSPDGGLTKADRARTKAIVEALRDEMNLKLNPAPAADIVGFLLDQCSFSAMTFGPGERLQGISDHIRKELNEVAMASPGPERQGEWIDVVMLALDGAWRSGMGPKTIFYGLQRKLEKNKARTWPDWRTADPNKAIEHDRTKDRSE